jgi:hypothetical protein
VTKILSTKAAPIQDAVSRLICALGPDRVAISAKDCSDPESVTILSRADPSRTIIISIAGLRSGRFAVTYDKLRLRRDGDACVEQTISRDVVFEGLEWIARKILDYGIVTEEFERIPDTKRIRGR